MGSIPAWAGEPQSDPEIWGAMMGLSPRGRGEPCPVAQRHRWAEVYPRVGGGTLTERPSALSKTGLSPRGRGNHVRHQRPLSMIGSIPAWAGEPGGLRGRNGSTPVYPRVGGGT